RAPFPRRRRGAPRTRRPSGPSSTGPTRAPRGSPRAPLHRRPAARAGRLRQRRLPASIPRDCPLEPVVELDDRVEADRLARLLDVRDAQLDVDVLERRKHDLARTAGDALDALGEVEDRDRRPWVADVEALADRVRMLE